MDDLFGLMVAYEVYALASGRLPPITRICRRYHAVCVPVVAVLLAHLAAKEKPCPT